MQIIDGKSSTKVKIMEAIFLVSTFVNLFLNVVEPGQLSFIIVSLVFTLNYFGKRIKYIVYLFISLIIIFFTAYYLSKPFYIRVHARIIKYREKANSLNLPGLSLYR